MPQPDYKTEYKKVLQRVLREPGPGPVWRMDAASVQDVLVLTRGLPRELWESSHVIVRPGQSSPSLVNTMDEALKLAESGWPEGAQQARTLSNKVLARLNSQGVRDDLHYDVDGGALDIARYLSGEPEHWYTLQRTAGGSNVMTRHLTLVFNAGVNCNWTTAEMISRAIPAIAIVDALERLGHRVRVIVGVTTEGTNIRAHWRITVKEYDQVMDIDRLAFWLAHPAVLRRFFFAATETTTDSSIRSQLRIGTGYGVPKELPQQDQGDIYVGETPQALWSEVQQVTVTKRALEAVVQNVDDEPTQQTPLITIK